MQPEQPPCSWWSCWPTCVLNARVEPYFWACHWWSRWCTFYAAWFCPTWAWATSEGWEVQEEHHLEEHAALKFNEPVVRNGIGEIWLQMLLDEEQVVVLEIAERTELEHYQDGHNLAVRQRGLAVTARLTVWRHKGLFIYFLIKFFAKFIHGTENFCNFVVGNHEYILLFNFISDWDSDIKVQKISQITNFLTTFLSRTGIFLINLFVLQKKYIPLRMRREFLW